MGLRYTAVAGMEQTSPRNPELDIDHWRDKIELRLDNRQVFFLFFGSAVVACMLFVLGVSAPETMARATDSTAEDSQ